MIRTHMENKAVVTIAALARGRGRGAVVRHHANSGRRQGHRLRGEAQDPGEAQPCPDRPRLAGEAGPRGAGGRPYLASMGIYLFNAKALVELLESSDATDFGHEILPQTIANHRVQAHLFDGYWEDIGTVGAFHQANIDLTHDYPAFDFTFGEQPIFTRPRYLPCSRISGATLRNSLICDGCIIGQGVGDREFGHRRPVDHRREHARSETRT